MTSVEIYIYWTHWLGGSLVFEAWGRPDLATDCAVQMLAMEHFQ